MPRPPSLRARAPGIAAVGLLLALVVTGCATAPTPAAPSVPPSSAADPVHPLAAGGLQDPRSREPATSLGPPTRIRIPSIEVDSALEDLRLGDGGRLDPPVDFDSAGWYSGGVVPGEIGPAIIAGHVDSTTGPSVFARLAQLSQGDQVLITMTDGAELSFTISGSMQSPKSAFPTADVYGIVPDAQLRLITCDGFFDASVGHYTDNLIVFAALDD